MGKGKYSAITPNLPRLDEEKPERQEKLNRIKAELTKNGSLSAATIAKLYAISREDMDRLNEEKSVIQLQLDAIEQLLKDRYEEEGLDMVRLDSGASVSVQNEPYAVVKDREAFRLWCLANGYEREMTLHPGTTNSIVKELLLAGEPPPPGVAAFSRTKLYLRGT